MRVSYRFGGVEYAVLSYDITGWNENNGRSLKENVSIRVEALVKGRIF